MKSRIRIWVLAVLAALTFIFRIADISEVVIRGAHHPMAQGFVWDIAEGDLIVRQVAERNLDRNPNPFYQGGLRSGDRVIEMGDRLGTSPIEGLYDFGEAMRSIRRDEAAVMIVSRADERGRWQRRELPIPAGPPYGLRSWMVFWGWTFVFPFIAVGTGFFIGFMRPQDDNAFTASLLLLCFSSYFGINHFGFPPGLREAASLYQSLLVAFLPYLFLRFFLLFPSPSPLDRWFPTLKHLALGATLVTASIEVYRNYLLSESFQRVAQLQAWPRPLLILVGFLPFMFLLGVLSLTLNIFSSRSPDERRRMRILLIGTLVGLTPLIAVVNWVSSFGGFAWELFLLACTALVVFPLSFAYAVVRHRVLGIQLIIRQGLRYALVSRGLLVVTWLLAFLLFSYTASPLLDEMFPNSQGFAVAAGATLVVLGAQALYKRVIPLVDRHFFRDAYSAQQILTALSHDVRHLATDPDKLLRTVIDRILDSLYPDQAAAFVQGAELVSEDQIPDRRIRFDHRPDADYRCLWRRRSPNLKRSKLGASPISVAKEEPDHISLDYKAFVPNHLRKYLKKEPEAFEIYFEDPKSWAAPLAQAAFPDEGLRSERKLLEDLNTRLIVPLMSPDQVLGFISLGEKLSQEPYSREDKQLLLTLAEQTSIALDYAFLIERVAEQEKLKRDLEIAKEVQSNLFPRNLPPLRTLEYFGVCHAAQGVGGDYYDFLALGTDRLCLALGDISGKGISAALLMAGLQAVLRARASQHDSDVRRLVADINLRMCSSTSGSQFATFFCGLYDDRERTLTYVNAGHNPPMLFRRQTAGDDRMPGWWRRARVDRLKAGGLIVGAFPDVDYSQELVQLSEGDVLVAFSDGVSEARNQQGDEFGEERLGSIVGEHLDLPADELCDLLVDSVRAFVGPAPQHDDLTLVIAKIV